MTFHSTKHSSPFGVLLYSGDRSGFPSLCHHLAPRSISKSVVISHVDGVHSGITLAVENGGNQAIFPPQPNFETVRYFQYPTSRIASLTVVSLYPTNPRADLPSAIESALPPIPALSCVILFTPLSYSEVCKYICICGELIARANVRVIVEARAADYLAPWRLRGPPSLARCLLSLADGRQ